MTGDYFSSFIQQTGVRIESPIGPEHPPLHQSPAEIGSGDKVAPIEVLEIKQVEPATVESIETPLDQPSRETKPPLELSPPEPVKRHVIDKTAPTSPTLPPDYPVSPMSEDRTRTAKPPEPEQTQSDVQGNSQRIRSQTDAQAERPSSLEVTIEREVQGSRADQLLPQQPASGTLLPGKQVRTGKQAAVDHGLSREQIQQSVLKEVRRWVASQPVLSTPEQRSQVTTKVVQEVEQTLQKAPEIRQTAIQGKTGKRRSGEPDIALHDLHLSIGPLNIKVEQPEMDTQRSKPQPRRETRTATDRGTPRLRRHYIRI